MLSVTNYTNGYVAECRRRVDQQVAAFRDIKSAPESFEHQLFNNMVLLLDYLFVHRARAVELKDGNPLNEVRVICNSLTQNGGLMAKDSQIKLDPAKSILKLKVGDEILVNESDFQRLADAFFSELERKFT